MYNGMERKSARLFLLAISAPGVTTRTPKLRGNYSLAVSSIQEIWPSGIPMGQFRSLIGLRTLLLAVCLSLPLFLVSITLTNSKGGENISSVALESMLVTHPDILEAGVVAVPDSHWGERPKAFVTAKEGRQLEGKDVVDWAKHTSGISKFMVPREVEVVPELPKTSTGKLRKNVLRDWAKGGSRS